MSFDDLTKQLQAPLDAKYVRQRDGGSGRRLSYVEGHYVIRHANEVFGFRGWKRRTSDMSIVQCEEKESTDRNGKPKRQWWVSYTCKSTIAAHGVTREGFGFGQGIDSDLGKAHESAIKEAETDAMKRAMMTFGDSFGLALYDKEQANVIATPEPYDFPMKKADVLTKAKEKASAAGVAWDDVVAECEKAGAATNKDVADVLNRLCDAQEKSA